MIHLLLANSNAETAPFLSLQIDVQVKIVDDPKAKQPAFASDVNNHLLRHISYIITI